MFIKVTKDSKTNRTMLINVNNIKSITTSDNHCFSESGEKIEFNALIRLIDGDFENVFETPEEIESMLKKKGILCEK